LYFGANTARGFYSLHSQAIDDRLLHVIILKGGPGTGKSTFIRRTGEELGEGGYDIEFIACSSDNESLDGLVVPSAASAIVDGTAPHVVEPRYPGAADTLLNLGDHWDAAALQAARFEIRTVSREVARRFTAAYRCLAGALTQMEQWEALHVESGALDLACLNQLGRRVRDDLLAGACPRPRVGRQRHLFASAITPGGCVNYLDSILADVQRRVILKGPPGTGCHGIMSGMVTEAVSRGYDVEVFHCSLDPRKYDHVVVPDLSIALVNGSDPHAFRPRADDRLVDTTVVLRSGILEAYLGEAVQVRRMYADLLEQAIWYLRMAKLAHDELETFYSAAMDFDAVERRRIAVRQEIEERAAGSLS
jgi:hypothetical protein